MRVCLGQVKVGIILVDMFLFCGSVKVSSLKVSRTLPVDDLCFKSSSGDFFISMLEITILSADPRCQNVFYSPK